MAAASTLAVVSASEPCSAGVGDEHAPWPRPSPAPCAARLTSPFGRHRHQADLAAAGRVDELQRHLDAVAVGLVEDQLAVALQRVGGGSSAPGSAGSGICLTQTMTFMGRHCYRPVRPWRTRTSVTRGRRYRRRLADPAGRELVRLVGHGAQHGRRAPHAWRAATRSRSSRPTAAATPPASPRTPPAAASTWSSASAATARSTRWPPASPAPTPRSACCPAGRRTCSPARSACPTIPCAAADLLADGIDAGDIAPDRARPRQRPLLLLPHRRRLRRRGRARRSRTAASLKRWARPPLFIYAGAARRGCAATTAGTRTSGGTSPTARRRVADGYFTIVLNTNPYTYLGNRPLDLSARRRRSTAAWWPSRSARCGSARSSARSAARCAAAG